MKASQACTSCLKVQPDTLKQIFWADGKAHASAKCDAYLTALRKQQEQQGEIIRRRWMKFWE